MQLGRIKEFFRRNIVMVVSIPGIIGMHYGWLYLQKIDVLVPNKSHQNNDLPIMKVCISINTRITKKDKDLIMMINDEILRQ